MQQQREREREAQVGIMPALATCSDLGNTGLGQRETDRTGSRQVTGFCLPASLNSDAVTLHKAGKMTQTLLVRIYIKERAEPSRFREFTNLL